MGKNKGTKMSIGEFMGDAQPRESFLPTAPKERGPDDDGSFRRRTRRDDNSRQESEPSRSEADSSWRRGGGGGGFDDRRGGGGFDDRRGGGFGDRGGGGFSDSGRGGFDDRRGGGGFDDRRGGGFGDRAGGGFNDRGGDRFGGSRSDDRRGGGFDDRRGGGGFNEERGGSFGGGRYNDRGGGDFDRNAGRSDGFRGSSGGERPRLSLQKRTAPIEKPPPSDTKPKSDPFGGATVVDTASKLKELEVKAADEKNVKDHKEAEKKDNPPDEDAPKDSKVKEGDDKSKVTKDKKKGREPKVINSRAAMLEAAPTVNRDNNNRRERLDKQDRAPPPVVNKRFEALAEEEREKMRERDNRRRDFGPPEPTNSRFAAAAEADRSHRDDLPRGPPPTQNSRFAAMVEEDRAERLPPSQGPPPTQNSRFAAAAAEAEREQSERDERRRERDNFYNRGDSRGDGPPMPQNSRFAAAVAADDDYVPEERRRDRGPPLQDRFGDRDEGRFDDRRGGFDERRNNSRLDNRGGGYDDRHAGYDDRRGGHGDRRSEQDDRFTDRGRVSDLLKPKERTHEDNILKAPELKVHSDNMFKVPEAKAEGEKKAEDQKTKEQESAAVSSGEVDKTNNQAATSFADQEKCVKEFVSSDKLGDDLKKWLSDQGPSVPAVEKLVFELLMEKELKNPDPECNWADPSKYGAALLALVEDDVYGQMQVLWGIQKYCDKLGFPKLNEEYLVQSMFRSMYKFDLAGDEAFAEWKEDESDEHMEGKLKAVIQTVDWYAWLEEEEEDDEEEYYEE